MPTLPVPAARIAIRFAILPSLLCLPAVSGAQLSVTPANSGRGFTISDYAVSFPSIGGPSGIGPIGIAFRPDNHVLVTDNGDQSLYDLPDHTDGQIVSGANLLKNYMGPPTPFSLAQVKISSTWHFYASTLADFVEIDPMTGTILQTITGAGGLGMAPFPTGITSPYAGHIFVTGSSMSGPTIWDIDPVGWSATPLFSNANASGDGLAISPDGSTIYLATPNEVHALDVPSGNLSWTGPTHSGEGFDGIALGLGTLAGYVYVNGNSGNVWEFGLPGGPNPGVDNLLLSGGSRGDFIAVDPDVKSGGFPSLLLTQTDRIVRVDPPGGGWFGPPTSSTSPVHTTGVDGHQAVSLRLAPVWPNPSRGIAQIDFALDREQDVRLSVHDLEGRQLSLLANGRLAAGPQHRVWNASKGSMAPGIYFVRLQAGSRVVSQRFALTR